MAGSRVLNDGGSVANGQRLSFEPGKQYEGVTTFDGLQPGIGEPKEK